jgi:sigma-E factor negative regulatory protein RseA
MKKNPQQIGNRPSGEATSELVSAMVDGELGHQESAAFLARVKSNPEWRDDWETYHLIGDAMRQLPPLSENFDRRMKARLAEEPTVLSPKRSMLTKHPLFALSAAASVAAITLVAWQLSQSSAEHAAVVQLASNQTVPTVSPQDALRRRNVSEYLIVHQEYSPSIAMQSVAPYVRTVYETQGEVAR